MLPVSSLNGIKAGFDPVASLASTVARIDRDMSVHEGVGATNHQLDYKGRQRPGWKFPVGALAWVGPTYLLVAAHASSTNGVHGETQEAGESWRDSDRPHRPRT